jgi:hypothetical protein
MSAAFAGVMKGIPTGPTQIHANSGERQAADAAFPALRGADGGGELVATERDADHQAADVGELGRDHDPDHVVEADGLAAQQLAIFHPRDRHQRSEHEG